MYRDAWRERIPGSAVGQIRSNGGTVKRFWAKINVLIVTRFASSQIDVQRVGNEITNLRINGIALGRLLEIGQHNARRRGAKNSRSENKRLLRLVPQKNTAKYKIKLFDRTGQ